MTVASNMAQLMAQSLSGNPPPARPEKAKAKRQTTLTEDFQASLTKDVGLDERAAPALKTKSNDLANAFLKGLGVKP